MKKTVFLLSVVLIFASCKSNSKGKQSESSGEVELSDSICAESSEIALPETVKLLKSITTDGICIEEFEYDDENRIVKINYFGEYINMITYKSGDLITIETVFPENTERKDVINYVKKGNTITLNFIRHPLDNAASITLDKDENIAKNETVGETEGDSWTTSFIYQYRNGNLSKMTSGTYFTYDTSETVYEYKYDDKKSLFHNCASPKWLIQYLIDSNYTSKNNVVERTSNNEQSVVKTSRNKYEYEYDSDGFPIKETMTEEYYHNGEEHTNTTITYFIFNQ